MPPLKVRLAIIAAIVVVAALVIDAGRFSGEPRRCAVVDTRPRARLTEVLLRCDDVTLQLEVPPLVAIFHGHPRRGQTIEVLVADDGDGDVRVTWDRAVARHPAATILAHFAVIGGLSALVHRRRRRATTPDRRGR